LPSVPLISGSWLGTQLSWAGKTHLLSLVPEKPIDCFAFARSQEEDVIDWVYCLSYDGKTTWFSQKAIVGLHFLKHSNI
jgi:hypothetical protein